MRIKVLRYAAGRDDRIVSAFENVVFETPQAGWYVESRAGAGRCGLDALALVERVGEVAFVVDVRDRNTLTPEHIRAVTDEALHLRQRMQERIDRGAWIPLPYVAAFEALGWDAAPLVAHRERVLRKREEIKRSCRERRERAAEQFSKTAFCTKRALFVALAVRTGISIGNIVSKYCFTGVSAKKMPRCSTQNQRMSNNASNRVEDTNEKGRDTEHTLKIESVK